MPVRRASVPPRRRAEAIVKLNRVAVKFPVRPETAEVDLEPFIPIFHEMIREKATA